MPRESTMLGCYSIVGLRGTARNYHDFPLPYFSKIECGKKLGSKELIKAIHLMDEINNGKDLGHNNYRKYVEEQPLRFNEQILNLVNLIKTA